MNHRPTVTLNVACRCSGLFVSVDEAEDHYFLIEGTYVDGPSDGEYVVRVTSDREDEILETNDADNVADTHITVEGDRITVLERGGPSPWDPQKVVVDDGWRPVF